MDGLLLLTAKLGLDHLEGAEIKSYKHFQKKDLDSRNLTYGFGS